jgi:hypothetical protein
MRPKLSAAIFLPLVAVTATFAFGQCEGKKGLSRILCEAGQKPPVPIPPILGKPNQSSGLAERQMTAQQLRDAAEAHGLFDRFYASALAGSYNPANHPNTDLQLARYRRAIQAANGKQILADEDVFEISSSLVPFFRHVAAVQQDGPNTVMVLPNQVRRIKFQTFCLDAGTPAPPGTERVQLVPIERLIPAHGQPIYSGLMSYAASNPAQHMAVQNLVWGMRHAHAQPPLIAQPSGEQIALLNEAVPNGAALYQQYLDEEKRTAQMNALKQQFFPYLEVYVPNLPKPSAAGYSSLAVDSLLRLLQNTPVTIGNTTPDSEYTLLAPGVAVRPVPGTVGVENMELEILNTSCQPYVFNSADFAGQSTRLTQRIALGGILPDSNDGTNPALAVVGLLDAQQLQALSNQLNTSVESGALSSADATLAMETAEAAETLEAIPGGQGIGAVLLAIAGTMYLIQTNTGSSTFPACPPDQQKCPANMPVMTFSYLRVPAIAAHIQAAQTQHPDWKILTIARTIADQNRKANEARCDQLKTASQTTFPGDTASCDEYPFASTQQGGSTASLAIVPLNENRSQGGTIRAFYNNPFKPDGAQFCVEVGP